MAASNTSDKSLLRMIKWFKKRKVDLGLDLSKPSFVYRVPMVLRIYGKSIRSFEVEVVANNKVQARSIAEEQCKVKSIRSGVLIAKKSLKK